MLTGNSWEDPYDFALETLGMGSSVFFILLTLFGAFFVQKLVLAVIADSYADESRIALDAKRRRAHLRKLNKTHVIQPVSRVSIAETEGQSLKPDVDDSHTKKSSFNPNVEFIPASVAPKASNVIASNAIPPRLMGVADAAFLNPPQQAWGASDDAASQGDVCFGNGSYPICL